jgi:hypothetical protein
VVTLKVKEQFFDRKAVTDRVEPARASALSRAGAFIRRRAQSLMRRRKAVSGAGDPPSVHAGQLHDLIFFAYDPAAQSVVAGPVRFRDGTAPALLEFGGEITRPAKAGGRRSRALHYTARPYMGPALRDEAENIPGVWKDSVVTGGNN